MKTKDTTTLPYVLFGSALLLLGAAVLIYYSTVIDDKDINFDLWDEDVNDYV